MLLSLFMLMESTTMASPAGTSDGNEREGKHFFIYYASCDWLLAAASSFGIAPSALWDWDFPVVRIKLHLLSWHTHTHIHTNLHKHWKQYIQVQDFLNNHTANKHVCLSWWKILSHTDTRTHCAIMPSPLWVTILAVKIKSFIPNYILAKSPCSCATPLLYVCIVASNTVTEHLSFIICHMWSSSITVVANSAGSTEPDTQNRKKAQECESVYMKNVPASRDQMKTWFRCILGFLKLFSSSLKLCSSLAAAAYNIQILIGPEGRRCK